MSRPLRIEIENGIYHVTSRGWERRVIVTDDRDRQRWLELLDREAATEFGVAKRVLQAKRVRNNEARAAALCLIRRLTSVPATQLADRYGGVSPAGISQAVQRAEVRCDDDAAWRRRLARLEKKLLARP